MVNTVLEPVDPNATRYLAAWTEGGPAAETRSFVDLSDAESGDVFRSHQGNEFAPFRRWVYGTAGGRRNAEIWIRRSSLMWYTFSRLNKAAFLANRAEFAARGFSLVHVNVSGMEISAIWWRPAE